MSQYFMTSRPVPTQAFTDSRYLFQVIGRLKRERIERELSLEAVARRASLDWSVIDHAEQRGEVPNSRDFKAWSAALELSWDQVWSDCLPGASGSSIEHLT